jgi:DNA-binding FadR family transcriptional regulator
MASSGLQAHEVVLRHIEAGILDGSLHPGDQLPTERDLAAHLGVGRSAVREAMRVLQTQGLITSSVGPGRGTRIAPGRSAALARLLQVHLALSGTGTGTGTVDLTETRIALERASAAMAAQRGSDRILRKAQAVVDAMNGTEGVDAFNELDTEFHVLIARAGQNQLISDLTVAIRLAVRDLIRDRSLQLANWSEYRLNLAVEHRGVLLAVLARDPEGAARLMEAHIRGAYDALGIGAVGHS